MSETKRNLCQTIGPYFVIARKSTVISKIRTKIIIQDITLKRKGLDSDRINIKVAEVNSFETFSPERSSRSKKSGIRFS